MYLFSLPPRLRKTDRDRLRPLFTFRPLPLFSVPRLRLCIAPFTSLEALLA